MANLAYLRAAPLLRLNFGRPIRISPYHWSPLIPQSLLSSNINHVRDSGVSVRDLIARCTSVTVFPGAYKVDTLLDEL